MENEYDVIIIGSGFGGTITALSIAREFYIEGLKDPTKPKRKVLLLERGTWWTTPVGTVADKEVGTYTFLKKEKNQPVQFWSSNNSFRGVVDLLTRCAHHEGNVDGLFELTRFGTTGLLGLFGKNDGLTVLRASGVGGGSLVYSNITVQPPDLIFNDPRWKTMKNWFSNKEEYYKAARIAIGTGILKALLDWDSKFNPMNYSPDQLKTINAEPRLHPGINTGLSQIVTRTAGLNPHWRQIKDANGNWDFSKNAKGERLFQIDIDREVKTPQSDLPPKDDKRDFKNDLWVDRARIFQKGMAQMEKDYGLKIEYESNTLSINDFNSLPLQSKVTDSNNNEIKAGDNQFDVLGNAANYCERQGRCNVGCLPGARHTLNKQLMNAAYGKFVPKRDSKGNIVKNPDGNIELDNQKGTPGIFEGILIIKALCEVDYINKLEELDYEIHYWEHSEDSKKDRKQKKKLRTKRVVLSAGCLGTNEIMLRSKEKGGIPNLSDQLGIGFSTNGDNFYLLGQTRERIRSTRGPAQSSHAQFNLTDPGNTSSSENVFHMIEDLGIPPALATTVGFGKSLFAILTKGQHKILALSFALIGFISKRIWLLITGPFKNKLVRQDMFKNEDEASSNFLIVTTTGREQAKGKIKLGGGWMQTPLRMERKDNFNNKELFIDDPVYKNIQATLDKMSTVFADENAKGGDEKFFSPAGTTIACSHPLGGCRVGNNASEGVVNEFGHVFDTSKGPDGIHKGLYIADGSVIPTSLGVNPSLSIAAVCWYIANNMRKELN